MKNLTTTIIISSLCLLSFTMCSSTDNQVNQDSQKPSTSTLNQPTPDAPPKNDFSCKLNDADWKGGLGYSGALFYAKGLQGAYNEKPHLTLAFKSNPPAKDQISFVLIDFDGKPGAYTAKKLEAGFFNADQVFGNRSHDQYSDLTVIVTAYELSSATKGIISGTVSGKFIQHADGKGLDLKNGVFTKIEVQIFNEKY